MSGERLAVPRARHGGGVRDRVLCRLAQHGEVLRVHVRPGEQHQWTRPQDDVAREIWEVVVVVVAGHGPDMRLDPVELVCGLGHIRTVVAGLGTQRAQRPLDLAAPALADARAVPVAGTAQRTLAERPAQRARQDADALEVELAEALEHRVDEPVAEHLLLELVRVDQHRRVQRVEGGVAELVEDARPGPAEVDLARVHVTDQIDLGVSVASAAVLVEPFDPKAAAGDAPDRLVERLELAQIGVRVGHREDLRLDGLRPAGAVRAIRAAAGQQGHGEEGGDERCAGHAATVWTARRAHHGAVPASHIRVLGSTLAFGRARPEARPRRVARSRFDRLRVATGLTSLGSNTERAERPHRPSTLDRLREIVAAAPRVIAASGELMTLAGLPRMSSSIARRAPSGSGRA